MTGAFDVGEVDRLLTTTRSVRRRLDLDRHVPRELIEEALEIAVQAPTANNHQNWRWLVLTEAAVKEQIAELAASAWRHHRNAMMGAGRRRHAPQARRMDASVAAFTANIGRIPALVLPCVISRPPDSRAVDEQWQRQVAGAPEGDPIREVSLGPLRSSVFYGSIYPAIWSFQLALRSRGLGSSISCLHLPFERQIGRLLGIPSGVTQICMVGVGYTLGGDFHPAKRYPAKERTFWERWAT
ncbi:nitroreductase family protein [Spongiactinospora sp. 9N601]|uniref:nitroreductase family protein n=1 Tax=Spongiactinospora sp. 9N601 TaxID=3375149 RepID=UPI00378FD785